MKTSEMIPLCERAIKEHKEIEIEYTDPFKGTKALRAVAPFDIGTPDPEYAQNFKDNLYAFSKEHRDGETGALSPQVVVFAIRNISFARLLNSSFDPTECCEQSLKHDSVDWQKRGFNLVPNRDWFAPQVIRI